MLARLAKGAAYAFVSIWLAFYLFADAQTIPHAWLDSINTAAEHGATAVIYQGKPFFWLSMNSRTREYLGNPSPPEPAKYDRADYNFLFSYLWAGADAVANSIWREGTVHSLASGRIVLGLAQIASALFAAWFLASTIGTGWPFASVVALHLVITAEYLERGKILSNTPFGSAALLAFVTYWAWLIRRILSEDARPCRAASPVAVFAIGALAMEIDYFLWFAHAALAVLLAGLSVAIRARRVPLLKLFVVVHLSVAAGLAIQAVDYWVFRGGSWLDYMIREYAAHDYEPVAARWGKGDALFTSHFSAHFPKWAFALAFLATAVAAFWSRVRGRDPARASLASESPNDPAARPRPLASHRWASLLVLLGIHLSVVWVFYHLFAVTVGGGPERHPCLDVFLLAPFLLLGAWAAALHRHARLFALACLTLVLVAHFASKLHSPQPGRRNLAGRITLGLKPAEPPGYEARGIEEIDLARLAWNLAYGYEDREWRYPQSLRQIRLGPRLFELVRDRGREDYTSIFQMVLGTWYDPKLPGGYLRATAPGEPWDAVIADPGAPFPGVHELEISGPKGAYRRSFLVTPNGLAHPAKTAWILKWRPPRFSDRLTEPHRSDWFTLARK